MAVATREGYADVPGGKVWYNVVGSGDAIPFSCSTEAPVEDTTPLNLSKC